MILVSIGMPRAGSGWYYNLTNDLMLAHGAQDARRIRRRYRLGKILTEVNCNIGALTPRRLAAVMLPSLLGNTFVIKAHSAPTPAAMWLIRRGQLRVTYLYRDPRDAMLSAIENGRRAHARGRASAFTPYADFDAAVHLMQDHLRIWEAWMAVPQALHVRYEDLLTAYDAEAMRLARFLGLDPERPNAAAVIERYRPEAAQPDQKGIHFQHGKIGRFRVKFSPDEQAAAWQAFSPFLEKMGYPA